MMATQSESAPKQVPMTDEQISLLLERLNDGQAHDIIIRPIGDNVWWGFAWGETPSGFMANGVQEEGFEFFFIRADDTKFAGAVLRMGSGEMHWYVSEEHRRKGLLVAPLKRIILPFVFDRYASPTQRGTINPHRPS